MNQLRRSEKADQFIQALRRRGRQAMRKDYLGSLPEQSARAREARMHATKKWDAEILDALAEGPLTTGEIVQKILGGPHRSFHDVHNSVSRAARRGIIARSPNPAGESWGKRWVYHLKEQS